MSDNKPKRVHLISDNIEIFALVSEFTFKPILSNQCERKDGKVTVKSPKPVSVEWETIGDTVEIKIVENKGVEK